MGWVLGATLRCENSAAFDGGKHHDQIFQLRSGDHHSPRVNRERPTRNFKPAVIPVLGLIMVASSW
jgi:hypothetical protein